MLFPHPAIPHPAIPHPNAEAFLKNGDNIEEEYYPGKSVVLNLVPTGIGCSIGGYAGDATPANNLLATVA